MKKKEEIIKTLYQEMPVLKDRYHVKAVGLFGSWAKDEQTETSDVDVIVEFLQPIGLFKFIELKEYLGKKFGQKVDLVTKDGLKPVIKPKILEEVIYV